MTSNDGWEPFDGGTISIVARKGDVIRRRLKPESPAVHALLEHLEKQGFDRAPRFLGVEGDYEFLSFVPGESRSPYAWDGSDDRALVRAAEIIRSYHDAVESFDWHDYEWKATFQLHDRADIVTHNDFGVQNCVFVAGLPHGMIDFDEAAPGTREWDLAYTFYFFVPMHPHADFTDAPRKLRLMCDAYGLEDRSKIIETMVERVARESEAALALIAQGGKEAELGNRVLPFSKSGLERLARERIRLEDSLH